MRYAPVMFLLLASCITAPSHMMYRENMNNLSEAPQAGKSAIYVADIAEYPYGNFGLGIETFIDRKVIGLTTGKSYFVKPDIEPGIHYVITRMREPGLHTDIVIAKINFEPSHVYYLRQYSGARLAVELSSREEFLDSNASRNLKLLVDNPNDPVDSAHVLSETEFQNAVNKYEKELSDGLHAEDAAYRGTSIK